ncbi:UvrD-helicase domain-containing protein [Burkholderia cepacia]|uniref:UvrD-helicase domain-containing protein n=1 Tax=Burkholderia cepacia TaxID=292 RepID=UPI001CF4955F|nr:UvrD-helicase domain-containing protein [Burkholderia cepacia]MCA8355604.1 UvrD-helicase domain-containing protein [Burkholderia cepacia]
MSRYPYTAEQQAVIDSDARILAVDAFAGTGKTSTLEGFALARPRARILYIAFNRSIAQSAKERFPQNVECRTTHSLAFAAVGRQYGDKLGNAAPFDIARRMNVSNRRAKQALDTISAWLCTTDGQIGLDHLPKEDLADGTGGAIVKLARAVWAEMTNLDSPIKMPHDGYLKLWAMSHPKLRYDYILLDEAQDTNPLTLDLVLSQKAHAKLVLVGDKHQGIYGFRKAVNAMKCVPADMRVAITQSFRFASGIASVASALLQEYKQERNVIRGRDDIKVSWQVDRRQPYAILSRTNAALFGALATLVTAKVPVKAVHYVGGFDGYIFGKVLDAYYLWSKERQSIRDESIGRFPDFSAFKQYGEEANDPEVKALVKVVEQYRSDVPSIYNALKAAEVPEDRAAVTVSTAHKSKGLEWEQVVLTDDFISLPPEEKDYDPEEINLLYVAITRAIRALEATPSVKALVDELTEAEPVAPKGTTTVRQAATHSSGFKDSLREEYERTWRQLDTAVRNSSISTAERALLQGRLEALSWVAEQMAISVDTASVS